MYFWNKLLVTCGLFALATQVHALELYADIQDTQPKYDLKDNKASGLCIDIYNEFNKRLANQDIHIKVATNEYTPAKRVSKRLAKNEAQIHCGKAWNKKRAQKFKYSKEPLYQAKYIVAVHDEDKRLDDVDTIEELVSSKEIIGALLGTNGPHYLYKNGLDKKYMHETVSITEGLQKVINGDISGYMYHDLGLEYIIRHREDSDKFRILDASFYDYEHFLLYSQSVSDETIAAIDVVLKAMTEEGVIQEFRDKYR